MVKAIHLVRHGHHGQLGRLCGRMPGVDLDDLGRRQMARCAAMMSPAPGAIQSSPQPRARQSAAIIAAHFWLPVEVVSAVDEIDVGEWTSLTFDQLAADPRWRQWNAQRGSSRPPSGESMGELQQRVVRHLEGLRGDGTDQTVAIVSHAEPIRAALMYYADIPLDDFLTVEVEPASISTLTIEGPRLRVAQINQRVMA